jgi:hypothetical protein
MCGRARFSSDVSEIKLAYSAGEADTPHRAELERGTNRFLAGRPV